MLAQIKEALTTLVVSMFSKKFIAFVVIVIPMLQQARFKEAIAAFVSYAGLEVVDKKKADAPQPTPSADPIPPEATPAPEPEFDPDADAASIED